MRGHTRRAGMKASWLDARGRPRRAPRYRTRAALHQRADEQMPCRMITQQVAQMLRTELSVRRVFLLAKGRHADDCEDHPRRTRRLRAHTHAHSGLSMQLFRCLAKTVLARVLTAEVARRSGDLCADSARRPTVFFYVYVRDIRRMALRCLASRASRVSAIPSCTPRIITVVSPLRSSACHHWRSVTLRTIAQQTIATTDISDDHTDQVRCAAPIFSDFGGRRSFHGPITTIKCFENNPLVRTCCL